MARYTVELPESDPIPAAYNIPASDGDPGIMCIGTWRHQNIDAWADGEVTDGLTGAHYSAQQARAYALALLAAARVIETQPVKGARK
jgi:hypothetical protein